MNFTKRLFWSFVTIILALIPTWLFIGGRSLLNPTGFLQEFFVLGVGVWLLGAAQFVLGLVCLIILCTIWNMPARPKQSTSNLTWDPIGEDVRRAARNRSRVNEAARKGEDYPELEKF